jgi:hypothetical protein
MLGWFHIFWTMKHTKISDGKCRENIFYIGSSSSQSHLRKWQWIMSFLLLIESPKFTAITVVIIVVIGIFQRGCHV